MKNASLEPIGNRRFISINLTHEEGAVIEAQARRLGLTPEEAAAVLLRGKIASRAKVLRLLACGLPANMGALGVGLAG